MTTQDIFETISSQYFQLTNSEKKVADYVLSHRIDAQYMSISELAEECEVADATISRFCRRLGVGGYNAFKLELAKASMAARTSNTAVASPLWYLCRRITPPLILCAAADFRKTYRLWNRP